MTLRLPESVLEAMRGHAARAYPQECCGILVGSCRGCECVATRHVEARNITPDDPARNYQVDWGVLLEVSKAVRRSGEDIVGFYHSHPDGTSQPSARDAAEAWVDRSYVVLAVRDGAVTDMASWRMLEGAAGFEREEVVVDDSAQSR